MLKMKMTPLRGEWWHANFHNLGAGATHGVEVYFPARPEALADSASPLLNRRSGFSRLFAMLALAGFTALSASAGILKKCSCACAAHSNSFTRFPAECA